MVLHFHDMERRLGAPAAYQCLVEIEKMARISSWAVAAVDPEIRLANAIRAQDAMHLSSKMQAA